MKTKYLLPSRLRILGWILVLICTPLGVWYLAAENSFPFHLVINIPWPFEGNNEMLPIKDGLLYLSIVDEVLALGALFGFFVVGFTKQLIEDERIALLRLEALQWGIYANYLLLALSVIFVHGPSFITVITYNMFTPLIIFVLRFYWLLFISPAMEAKRERSLV
ncbi:hypothetical protein [Dyadobacter psychrotolerans]|uniref:Uncharacterized protein n=1 Tax=Dyadobacter psychrotolerans TaxID=2541721 RepID=A0A4R5DQS8_9BACT|nr:hypothetical protein [Dyadobacter psychrotolerans]TDE16742.1 hypothetical protein E0F88_10985 [Dyadobacter psychrotolerans]